jgi:recombination protein RecA
MARKKRAAEKSEPTPLEVSLAAVEAVMGTASTLRGRYAKEMDSGVQLIPSGSLGIDSILGGGWPRGRVVEIYGSEGSGKTTLCLHIAAETQAAGGVAAYVDAEHAVDPAYAETIGVGLDSLIMVQPDYGEQGLEVVEGLVKSGACDTIIVDSVAALVPKAELDGEIGDAHVALQGRMMSQAMRRLTALVARKNVLLVFINQLRAKIGVTMGKKTTTTGGNALKYYSSVRLEITRIGALKQGEEVYGARTRVKAVKNRLAPPFQACEFDLFYGKGIDKESELVTYGMQHGIIQKAGSWYSHGDVRIGQGLHRAKDYVHDNPEVAEEIRKAARGEA